MGLLDTALVDAWTSLDFTEPSKPPLTWANGLLSPLCCGMDLAPRVALFGKRPVAPGGGSALFATIGNARQSKAPTAK